MATTKQTQGARAALATALATTLALGLAAPAHAACNDAATTVELRLCLSEAHEAADAELNEVYGQLRDARGGDFMARVRDAQRAWIPFRDAACEAEAALYEGGSMQPVAQISCLTRLTQRRSEDLRLLLQN